MIGLLSGSGGAVILLVTIVGYIYYRRCHKSKGKHNDHLVKPFVSTIYLKLFLISNAFTLDFNTLREWFFAV